MTSKQPNPALEKKLNRLAYLVSFVVLLLVGMMRRVKIETDIDYAKECILTCIHHISEIEISNDLCLITSQDLSNESFRIPTNVYRELTYLIEHTIHHMAIIKMAYSETYPLVKLPADFGIAYSTLKYQKSCAQ